MLPTVSQIAEVGLSILLSTFKEEKEYWRIEQLIYFFFFFFTLSEKIFVTETR